MAICAGVWVTVSCSAADTQSGTDEISPSALPASTPQTLAPQVTLDPTKASAFGILMLERDGEAVPVTDSILYLAETLRDDQGADSLAAFDRLRSPRTVTDSQGRFAFVNVNPGKYGLVLDTIINSYLLLWPGEQEAILIELREGETADLGTLNYEDLPIPNP